MKKVKENKIRQKKPKQLRFSRIFLRRMLPFLLAAAVIDIRALINLRNNIVSIDKTDTDVWWADRVNNYFTTQNGASESEADSLVKEHGISYLISRMTNSIDGAAWIPSTTSEISVMLVRPEKFEYYISGAQVILITQERVQDHAETNLQCYAAVPEEAEQIESEVRDYGKEHYFGNYYASMTSVESDPIIAVFRTVSEKLNLAKHIQFKGPGFENPEPLQAYVNTEDKTFCGFKYAWVNHYSDRSRLVYSYDAQPGGDWKLISTPLYHEQEDGQYLYNRDAKERYYGIDQTAMEESPSAVLFYGFPANCITGNHMREIGEYIDGVFPEFKELEQTLKEIIEDESGTLRDMYYQGAYAEKLEHLDDWRNSIQLSETDTPTPEEMLEILYETIGNLPRLTHFQLDASYQEQIRSFATSEFSNTNQVELNGEKCYLFMCGFDDNLKFALPHLVFMNTQIFILAILVSLIWGAIAYLRKKRQYEMDEYRRNLTAALAHDLKSPLTAISGYAENLSSGVHPEKQTHYSDSILEGTQYMDNIITNVLDLAKLEQNTKAKIQRIELVQMLREINANRQDEIESRKLKVEITGSCNVKADPVMMMQALRNLLDNAVKFTPDGGSITVTGEGSSLRIVNDIAEDKVERVETLCEAFVKGDSSRSNRNGTGLGLSVVRQIAELNKLHLSIESSDHKFTVLLRDKSKLLRR